MKIKLAVLVSFTIIFQSCKNEIKKPVNDIKEGNIDFPAYELIGENESIIVETFDSTVVDINKYNHNNVVFKVGTEFIYTYEHITNDNKIQYFKKTNGNRGWEFVDSDSIDFSTLQTIKISVADGNPMSNSIPDYNQTNLKYVIFDESSYSMSGVIENEANLWMHPPRDYYFRILELNPFPYIKAPYKIGNEWNWSLTIGDGWADERWKLWDGKIENVYSYRISDKQTIKTNFGEIDCFIIESKANSRIGETKLISYFNNKYGFVILDYTNIDGSKTKLELIEHSNK
jgi:hypothetical protein